MSVFTAKRWTKEEEDILSSIPEKLSKQELQLQIKSKAKELNRSITSVWQKHYKLINGFYKWEGKDHGKEYVVSKEKPYKKGRGVKKAVKGTATPTKAKKPSKTLKKAVKSISLSSRVRVTPTTIVVLDYKSISVKGKNLKITY